MFVIGVAWDDRLPAASSLYFSSGRPWNELPGPQRGAARLAALAGGAGSGLAAAGEGAQRPRLQAEHTPFPEP